MKRPLLFLFVVLALGKLSASPFDDLHSSSPDIRAHAAELIRENHLYHPTPRLPWDEMTQSLKIGESFEDFLKIIQAKGTCIGLKADMFASNRIYHNGITGFALDESWWIECRFNDSKLMEWKLVEEPREIVVLPPSGYSGTWHTYRISGEAISHLYIDGRPANLE